VTTNGSTAALILAGGKSSAAFAHAAGGVTNRALVPLAGRPMLDYVVEAVGGGLRDGGRVLVATTLDTPVPAGCVRVVSGASLVDTLLAGVRALEGDETRLLVATADIPFLTGASVADFLERARETGAGFAWPIVPADVCAAKFPGMRRTTLRLREGTFTGGNLALLDPAFLREREAVLREAYARRKSVVGLARLLGAPLLLRLAASRLIPGLLSIAHAEAAVGRVLGVRTRAVVSAFAELGADVDKPEDLDAARRWAEANRFGATTNTAAAVE